jgi:hypothetical protein
VCTVLTYAGAIRCDRTETKQIKKQELSKKKTLKTPKEEKKRMGEEA